MGPDTVHVRKVSRRDTARDSSRLVDGVVSVRPVKPSVRWKCSGSFNSGYDQGVLALFLLSEQTRETIRIFREPLEQLRSMNLKSLRTTGFLRRKDYWKVHSDYDIQVPGVKLTVTVSVRPFNRRNLGRGEIINRRRLTTYYAQDFRQKESNPVLTFGSRVPSKMSEPTTPTCFRCRSGKRILQKSRGQEHLLFWYSSSSYEQRYFCFSYTGWCEITTHEGINKKTEICYCSVSCSGYFLL